MGDMKKAGTPRTLMTDGRLNDAVSVLQYIISACKAYATDGMSWNEACRVEGLDPLRVRKLVLGLPRCRCPELPPVDSLGIDNIYNGYEQFYRAVFGGNVLERSALPHDYKESVMHVLENTGLMERDVTVLIHRFGLNGECPMTLDEIGALVGTHRETVRQSEAKALRKCRCEPRAGILRMGLAKYTMLKEQADELARQKSEQAKAEHKALMAKRDAAHKERMEAIESGPYEAGVAAVMSTDLPGTLRSTRIEALGLTGRSYNALKRHGLTSLYELLELDRKKLMMVRNLGKGSVEEIIGTLDAYVQDNLCMTSEELRELCFPGKER